MPSILLDQIGVDFEVGPTTLFLHVGWMLLIYIKLLEISVFSYFPLLLGSLLDIESLANLLAPFFLCHRKCAFGSVPFVCVAGCVC